MKGIFRTTLYRPSLVRPQARQKRPSQRAFLPQLAFSFATLLAGLGSGCASDGTSMSFTEYKNYREESNHFGGYMDRNLKYHPRIENPPLDEKKLFRDYMLTPLNPYQKPRSSLDR